MFMSHSILVSVVRLESATCQMSGGDAKRGKLGTAKRIVFVHCNLFAFWSQSIVLFHLSTYNLVMYAFFSLFFNKPCIRC